MIEKMNEKIKEKLKKIILKKVQNKKLLTSKIPEFFETKINLRFNKQP
jgi:hypothetical protein